MKAFIRPLLDWHLRWRCRRFPWNALEKAGQKKKAEEGARLLLEMATRHVPLAGVGQVSAGWFSTRAVHLPVWLLSKLHCFDPAVGRHVVRQLIRENHVQSQVASLETMWNLLYEKPDVETVVLFLGEDRFWGPGGTPLSYRTPDILPGYLKSANPADLPVFLRALSGRFSDFSDEGLRGLVEAMVKMLPKVDALPMDELLPLSESIGEWVKLHIRSRPGYGQIVFESLLFGGRVMDRLPALPSAKAHVFFAGLALALEGLMRIQGKSMTLGHPFSGFEIKPGTLRDHPWLAPLGTGTHPYADLFALHPFWSSCNQALLEREALEAVLPEGLVSSARRRL